MHIRINTCQVGTKLTQENVLPRSTNDQNRGRYKNITPFPEGGCRYQRDLNEKAKEAWAAVSATLPDNAFGDNVETNDAHGRYRRIYTQVDKGLSNYE